ncbi:MAG TPA: SRPBCC family protein [Solirubrobacterales bacterium]|nr:SRPBCC family protein [Solirubrobacterales bacterium]
MKPVAVSATVVKPREEVYEFLDVLANHEGFMDHLFVDWSFSGPARGVGARARARVSAPGSREWAEFEVVEAERPERIVEEGVSSAGKRRTRGTYRLEELPGGGTKISFQLAWTLVPRSERLVPALARLFVRRANGKAMRRLARQLDQR